MAVPDPRPSPDEPEQVGPRGLLSAARVADLIAIAAVAAGLVCLVTPLARGTPAPALSGAGVVVLAVGLWSTGRLPEYVTAIIVFFTAMVFGVAPAEVVFSGFGSGAVWLVFGGLVLGAAVHRSGLGRRAVGLLLHRPPQSYLAFVARIACVGFLLALFIPSSTGRTILLTPIAMLAAEHLGYARGSRGYVGTVLASGLGTMFPAFALLPSNVPNMVMVGGAESLYGVNFGYGTYFALNFPVFGFVSLLVLPLLIHFFFREPIRPDASVAAELTWSPNERKLLVVLTLTLIVWASDAVHGISPAWVALGAAVALLAPRIGVLRAEDFIKDVDFGPWLFVAGVISLGAIAAHTGLGAAVGEHVLAWLELRPGEGFRTFAAITGLGMAVSLVTTISAAPAIMTPLAATLADSTGWPLAGVLMAQVGTWAVFPFPHQVPPVLVTLSLGGIPIRRIMVFFLTYFAIGVVLLLPLHYLWGAHLGYFAAAVP